MTIEKLYEKISELIEISKENSTVGKTAKKMLKEEIIDLNIDKINILVYSYYRNR